MKTLTPEQRREGFVRLIGRNKDGHLWSFLAGIEYAEMVFGEEPKVPFARLTEEEVTEILTSAYDMYAAICAVENRLVEKNRG